MVTSPLATVEVAARPADETARSVAIVLLVTTLVAGGRCVEIAILTDRWAGAFHLANPDYATAIGNLFFATSPPPLLGLTSFWLYGFGWLALMTFAAVALRLRK